MGLLARRYYGLDALRASMILLGIVFHVSLPYTGLPMRGYYVTQQRSLFLFITAFLLHYFRMPMFFLLSGFLSGMIWGREGTRKFLHIRSRRIGLVWLLAQTVLLPMSAFAGIYNHFASEGGNALTPTLDAITSFQINVGWLPEVSIHLWFLEYLMLFSLCGAVLMDLLRGFATRIDYVTNKVLWSRLRIFVLAVPTAATLNQMPFAVIPYPTSLVPWFWVVLAYGWFYAVGWLIYRRRDLLPFLVNRMQGEKLALPIFMLATVLLLQRRNKFGLHQSAQVLDLGIALFTALTVWSTVMLLMTACQNVGPSRRLTYLADSSYWVYLMHYPLAMLMPALLRNWQASALTKVVCSTSLIFAVLLLTYDRFVRYTAMGRVLHGTRVRTHMSTPSPQPHPSALTQAD